MVSKALRNQINYHKKQLKLIVVISKLIIVVSMSIKLFKNRLNNLL